MNAFLRNLSRIALISIGVGILLIVVAYSMNKSVFDKIARDGFNLLNYSSDWSDWNEDLNDDLNSNIENNDFISGVALTSPGKSEELESLDINMIAGTLSIVEGEEFNLQVDGLEQDNIKSEFSNGVWSIEDTLSNSSDNSGIKIFGININSESLRNNIGNIRITIPKDFNGKKINLKCGAGSITADKITADEISVSVGAGSCSIDELISKEKSEFIVGAGEIIINNLSAVNAKFNCSMGSIYVKGILKGTNQAVCSMGTIDLDLEGRQEDYNYTGKCSMGTVSINNSNYTGVNQNFEKDNDADNDISINCSVGTVNLKISD